MSFPSDVTATLAQLTGMIEMPPLWAVGYHQCRWSYFPASRAIEVAGQNYTLLNSLVNISDEFRARKIPCDVIWFDIHYMDGGLPPFSFTFLL